MGIAFRPGGFNSAHKRKSPDRRDEADLVKILTDRQLHYGVNLDLRMHSIEKPEKFRCQLGADAFIFVLEEYVGTIPGLRQNVLLPLQ